MTENSAEQTDRSQQEAPNYEVEIQADELLSDLAEMAAEYARDVVENREWWEESPVYDRFDQARYWELEAIGGRRAISQTMRKLHPETKYGTRGPYLNDDGTVDVRGLLEWLSKAADDAHERRRGSYEETRQPAEAESAYVSVISLIRDGYGVGWARIDEIGRVVEADLP